MGSREGIMTKTGSAEPKHFNPYNNTGVDWALAYDPDRDSADIRYSGGVDEEEEVENLGSFEAACQYAQERAEEHQASIDSTLD